MMAAHAKFTMNGSPSATCINSVAAWTGAALKAWTANPVATALKATYVSRDDERPRQSTSAITLILSHSLSNSPISYHPSFVPSSFIIVSHIPIHIIIRARATRPVPRALSTRAISRARVTLFVASSTLDPRARARALIRTNGVLTSSSHPTQSFPIAISPSQTAIRFPGHRSRAIRKPSSSRSIDTRARTRAHIACANVLDALATRERTKRIPFHSVFAILIIPPSPVVRIVVRSIARSRSPSSSRAFRTSCSTRGATTSRFAAYVGVERRVVLFARVFAAHDARTKGDTRAFDANIPERARAACDD